MTKRQLRTLINETLKHLPDQEANFLNKIEQEYPPSSEGLPKSKLYIRMADNIPREKRNHFKNDLLNHIKDDQVFIFDSFSFSDDIK